MFRGPETTTDLDNFWHVVGLQSPLPSPFFSVLEAIPEDSFEGSLLATRRSVFQKGDLWKLPCSMHSPVCRFPLNSGQSN